MSFSFSMKYRSPLDTFIINRKFHEIWGRNGVLSGFVIQRKSDTAIKIVGNSEAIVEGVKVNYTEENPGNPLSLELPHTNAETLYIYGLYNHKLSSFVLKSTTGKYDAQGQWKVFLGHVKMAGGAIIEVQGIVDPKNVDLEPIYRRMPNMNELINFFYEATDQIGDQITVIMNDMLGDLKQLKTKCKSTIVCSINELVDTKEPTLTRERILELLGGADGNGNINIGSINGIPIDDFALKKDLHSHVNKSLIDKIRYGGETSTSLDTVDIKNLVELDLSDVEMRSYKNTHGDDEKAGVYSQLAYFASERRHTGMLKVTLPRGYTNAMLSITLLGYLNNEKGSSYKLNVSGKLDKAANKWINPSVNLLGKVPFRLARLGHTNDNKCCILLGDTDTVWDNFSLFIDKVIAGGEDNGSWRDGWQIEPVTSDADFNVTATPPIITGGPQEGEYVVPNRAVLAGDGLSGGGTLNKDVTLSVKFGDSYNSVSRGNHTHEGTYLNSQLSGKNGVLVTDSNGNVKVDDLIWDYELRRLHGVRSDIQEQIDSKAGNGHTHNYLPLSGGTMNGAVNMQGHRFDSNNLYVNGCGITVSKWAPSPEYNRIWIQLP